MRRRLDRLSAVPIAAVALGITAAAAARAAELQVNSYTVADQQRPSVAMDAEGDFVVVWESFGQDGANFGVFGQRFSSSGSRLGAEFQVNSYTTHYQHYASIGMEPNGDFVVVWHSIDQDDSGRGIFARRFSSAGVALAVEFQVNTHTTHNQMDPDIAMDDDGDFVVVWHSRWQDDGNDYGVFGQRFASSGAALGGEFQVNVYTPGAQKYASVGMDADGDFVVAWASETQDGPSSGVFARRFSSSGVSIGEFAVNTYTTGFQGHPAVAMTDLGAFVVIWESGHQDGEDGGLFARRFDSATVPIGGEFQVNQYTVYFQDQAAAAFESDGDFLVAWRALYAIGARRFSSAGTPQSPDLRVNTYTPATARFPAVAGGPGGSFVVTWDQSPGDGSGTGVLARLFTLATIDVDGDGSVEPLTDGLLVLRSRFGLTGPSLVAAAVDVADCTRCDAPAIEAYLSSIASQLDIDGDGSSEALTDGLLVLRWLFGLIGSTLVSGVVDLDDCTRCDAASIEPYLQGLGV